VQGILRKMIVAGVDPVEYTLRAGDESLLLNALIGQSLKLIFTGEIFCIECGRKTRTSFGQGFCYPCFQESAACSPCIIRPELCRAHEGIGRDMEWERKHHLQEQIVYLTHTGGVKVGVTRSENLPTRWIDQGATLAVHLAATPNRYEAGLMEVTLKDHIADKTNWRRMLCNGHGDVDTLLAEKRRLEAVLGDNPYLNADDEIMHIRYPLEQHPEKVKSMTFKKETEAGGILSGMKGQYLIFDDGRVFNVRSHQGHNVVASC
jgi:hypothetical protein